jgi:phospholipid-transporting ATPase
VIRTSKYSALTFVPLNLFMQFNKAPNVYFLIITFMQMVKEISISNGQPAMALPLVVIVIVSMIKDAFEDFKRHKADDLENNTICQVYDTALGSFKTAEWKRIVPGNIIKVESEQFIPADLLILTTSEEKGGCYVETKNLDGETNLKTKNADKDLHAIFRNF